MKYIHAIYLSVIGLILPVNQTLAQRYELVWSDEFDGETLDQTKWSYQYATGGSEGLTRWGNGELQYYTDRQQNVSVNNGTLKITALKEAFASEQYTSGRIRSRLKGDWKCGIFRVRAKIPRGDGLWPAIWMLPTDLVYGGWPKSGEIDIMEAQGDQTDKVYGTIHYGYNSPNNASNGGSLTKSGTIFADEFHEFMLVWTEKRIAFYVDDQLFYETSNWFSPNGAYPAPFDQRFHLLLNLAVGGNFGGPPTANTSFPQSLEVDYVRVYQDVNKAPEVTATNLGGEQELEAGSTLELPVSIVDTDGEVTSVSWYINGVKFKDETINESGAYALNWPVVMSGCYDVYVVSRDNENGKDSTKVASIKTSASCDVQPYWDEPVVLPAVIPAVNYNRGGQSKAYYELTPLSNSGGIEVFRFQEAVDTRLFRENEYIVSDAQSGEWLTYTITVPETADYNITAQINRIDSRTKLILFVDEVQRGEYIRFPANGESGTSNRTVSAVNLTAGEHTIRFLVDLAPTELLSFNFEKVGATSIETQLPYAISVSQWPNPFNPTTQIKVELNRTAQTTISVFDIAGRKVQILFSGRLTTGEHSFMVDATTWPSGVYLYSVQSDLGVFSGKMVLIK